MTSQASDGVLQRLRKLPARFTGLAVFREVATGLPHQPERVYGGFLQQGAQEGSSLGSGHGRLRRKFGKAQLSAFPLRRSLAPESRGHTTSRVKISRRPSSMAKMQTHVWKVLEHP